jgi:hypothetical protein
LAIEETERLLLQAKTTEVKNSLRKTYFKLLKKFGDLSETIESEESSETRESGESGKSGEAKVSGEPKEPKEPKVSEEPKEPKEDQEIKEKIKRSKKIKEDKEEQVPLLLPSETKEVEDSEKLHTLRKFKIDDETIGELYEYCKVGFTSFLYRWQNIYPIISRIIRNL